MRRCSPWSKDVTKLRFGKRSSQARECYDKAISPRTSHLDPIYRRGVAAIHSNDFMAATADLEHVTAVLAAEGAPLVQKGQRAVEASEGARLSSRSESGMKTEVSAFALCVMVLAAVASQTTAAGPEPRFRLKPLDASGLIPYFITEAVDGSHFQPGDRELAEWALAEWTRSANGAIRFERVEQEDAAVLRFLWLPWAEDAALGRMDPLIVSGREGASITVRPDEDRFRPSIRRGVRQDPLLRDVVMYYVCLHEIGHALGLSHSDNPLDVMWPGNNGVTLSIYERYRHPLQTRDDIPRNSWLSHNDVARFNEIWNTARIQRR